jgi:hypothetical protein
MTSDTLGNITKVTEPNPGSGGGSTLDSANWKGTKGRTSFPDRVFRNRSPGFTTAMAARVRGGERQYNEDW